MSTSEDPSPSRWDSIRPPFESAAEAYPCIVVSKGEFLLFGVKLLSDGCYELVKQEAHGKRVDTTTPEQWNKRRHRR